MRPSFTTLGRWLGAAALLAVSVQPALAQRNVTLRLNTATLSDTLQPSIFNPQAAEIEVRGCLADTCDDNMVMLPDGNTIAWDDRTTLNPANDGGDYWSLDFQIPDNEALNFKFYSVQTDAAGLDGWEGGDNQTIDAGTGDVALELHYFEGMGDRGGYGWRPFTAEGDSIAVWLRVYMKTENAGLKGYDEDDGATDVGARGNFGTLGAVDSEGPVVDWGEGGDADSGVRLTRESTDSAAPGYNLWSGLVKYPATAAGMEAQYKFYFFDSNNTGDGGYEDADNRVLQLPAAGADTTIHWVYYSDSKPLEVELVTANTTFQVDVAPLAQAGIFQAGADQMQLRGGFNGWDCPEDNQDDCLLQQQPFSTVYSREFPITSAVGAQAEYKFYLDFDEDYATDIGWEEPLDNGGGNRKFVFSGNEETVGPKLYNDVRSGNVVAAGRTVNVTFQVDMAPAMDLQPLGFDPARDTVAVQFEDPVWLVTQGYEPGDARLIPSGDASQIAGFTLTDPDGDMVYTGTFPITGPTYNGIAYRHTFGSEAEGQVTEGSGGFQEGRRRYRYVTDASASSFTFARDSFRPTTGDDSVTKLPWEANPTGGIDPASDTFLYDIAPGTADPVIVAGEEAPRTVEGALSLSAAYPNPASGVARMRVAVASDAVVSIRVYDVTGRQVAVVADGFQTIGEREVSFDASSLASGVYVVRAQAGADVVTRRLTITR